MKVFLIRLMLLVPAACVVMWLQMLDRRLTWFGYMWINFKTVKEWLGGIFISWIFELGFSWWIYMLFLFAYVLLSINFLAKKFLLVTILRGVSSVIIVLVIILFIRWLQFAPNYYLTTDLGSPLKAGVRILIYCLGGAVYGWLEGRCNQIQRTKPIQGSDL